MDWPAAIEAIRTFLTGHAVLIRTLATGSAAFFLLTPILAPAAVVLMPPDTLVRERKTLRDMGPLRAAGRLAWHLLKNLLGAGFIILGIILLFMPGQGLLTIFIGLLFTDIPGRRKMLTRLLAAGKIRPLVDRLRLRYRREPVTWPEDRD